MTWDELLPIAWASRAPGRTSRGTATSWPRSAAKIFAFLGSGRRGGIGLKCGATREAADEWLARYPADAAVMPYIGRSGWNSLRIGGDIPADELLEAIDASYEAVVSKLPKKDRPPAADPARRKSACDPAARPPAWPDDLDRTRK